MKQLLFLALVAIASVCTAAEKPNILLIMADDFGWGDVGFNGNGEIKTPHLDDMASSGMRLTRFYTASPLCSPTRGSCLTGRYPWRFGVLAAHTGGMRMAEYSVAEVAHSAKYQTGDIDGQALVENRYKLIHSANPGGSDELYDLIADPAEMTDLSTSKSEILAAMKTRMAQYDESCRKSRDGADYEF